MKHLYKLDTFITENTKEPLKLKLDIKDLKVGQMMKYRRDDNTTDEKPIERIDVPNNQVFFKDHEGKEFSKTPDEILEVEETKQTPNKGESIQEIDNKVKEELGKIKTDPKKMSLVLKYLDFIKGQ